MTPLAHDAGAALSDRLKRFLREVDGGAGLLIGGEYRTASSGATLETADPSTGERVADVSAAQEEDVADAVLAARCALVGWSDTSPLERSKALNAVADVLDENAEDFATLTALDNGKPVEAARGDVAFASNAMRYAASLAATETFGDAVSPFGRKPSEDHAYTMRVPVGVVGAIVPWNFDLMIACFKVAPALAAGCTVVLKPAEETPLCAMLLARLVTERGILPPGVLNVVTGDGETAGASLSRHPGVDKVAFTGSTEVGSKIVGAAAADFKRVELELGGKSPVAIFADADLSAAVPAALSGFTYNAGQVCCAGTRIFVERPAVDAVLEQLEARSRDIVLGGGLNPEATVGPLVSAKQLERVERYVSAGQAAGAEVAFGGARAGSTGYFYEPTVMLNADASNPAVEDEIFGPVTVVAPFDDVDELVVKANDTVYGLAAGVWTTDVSTAHAVARRLDAGTVWINSFFRNDASQPWGGLKHSGWGREFGPGWVSAYTETKTVVVKL